MPIRPNLPVKGHGRNGASAFMGAESVVSILSALFLSQRKVATLRRKVKR